MIFFGQASQAVTITQDFESTTAPGVPTGWTTVGASGNGSYATTVGEGNPGQSGNVDWTGSNQTAPGVYLVNDGTAFDATKPISGSFDFYVEDDGNYSSANFIFGDINDGLTGNAGEFLNVLFREKTFGARAALFDGADGALVSDSSNNRELHSNAWNQVSSFSWTPTSGLTGDFSITWTDPSYSGPENISYTGYTFDSDKAFFGFGTGRSPGRFDNISITGTLLPPPPLYSSGGKTWDTTTANWGTATGGPYNTTTWDNSAPSSAVFEGTGGTVNIGAGTITAGTVLFDNFTGTYTLSGGTLDQSGGITVGPNAGNVSIKNTLSGNGGLIMNGPGKLDIRSASNNFTGAMVVTDGILHAFNNLPNGNLTLNGGVYENYWTGTFSRSLGTGNSQVQLTGGESGFSGAGSQGYNVNIGGVTELQWGSTYFQPTILVLQASTANTNGRVNLQDGIDLNGANRTIAVNKDHGTQLGGYGQISGVVRDALASGAGLIKTGPGRLLLSGNNTFTGGIVINEGKVRTTNNSGLGNSGPITFGAAGTELDLQASTVTIGALASTGTYGTITRTSGTGTVNLTVDQDTNTAFSGTIEDGTSSALSLVKAGNGTLQLNGVNNYSGDTTVSGGILQIGQETSSSLGGGSYAGNISLSSGTTLRLWSKDNEELSGTISGDGNIEIANGGTTILSGNNTYTGKTSVIPQNTRGSTLSVDSFNSVVGGTASSALGAPTTVANGTIQLGTGGKRASCTLIYTGTGETTDRVINLQFNDYASQTIINSGTGLLKFTSPFTSNASSQTGFLKLDGSGDGEIAGGLPQLPTGTKNGYALRKEGGGTWTLGGTSSFSGPTSVQAGTLVVNGSMAGTDITVENGAFLKGSGSGLGSITVNSGGTLAPGTSIESLSSGTLNLASGSTFEYEIDSDAAPGTTGDLTAVTGDVNITSGAILNLVELGSGTWGNEKLTLISYTGAWNGGLFSYDSNVLNDGDILTFSGTDWLFNYDDTAAGVNFIGDTTGASGFITMTAQPIPEPSTLILGALGLMGLTFRRRRK